MSVLDLLSDVREVLGKLAELFVLFAGTLALLTLVFLISLRQLLGIRGWAADVLTKLSLIHI